MIFRQLFSAADCDGGIQDARSPLTDSVALMAVMTDDSYDR